MYGTIECDGCGHVGVGKIVNEIRPAGRDSCPRCGETEFSVVE